jgi:signal recognition particle GTPase
MSTNAAEMSWDDIKALVAELAIQSKETDRKFQETERLLKERSEETDRKFQETDRKFQETDRKFQETRELDVSEVYRRVTSHRGGEAIEIALLVTDSDVAVALKCRSHLTREEVERHVERMKRKKGHPLPVDILPILYHPSPMTRPRSTLVSSVIGDRPR